MTQNAGSGLPVCEPKCHAWGIGCACSGARVYRHPEPETADYGSPPKAEWRKRLGAALVARGDVYAVVDSLLAEARSQALAEAADAVEDECTHSRTACFCGSADWLRKRAETTVNPPGVGSDG
jgi:hypothetical protein